jgi:hypothetical protein
MFGVHSPRQIHKIEGVIQLLRPRAEAPCLKGTPARRAGTQSREAAFRPAASLVAREAC